MKTVLVTGVSVIDFIFQLDEIPKTYEKFRANNAFITGGGPAANAAVAVSRLGGSATLVSRLGEDDIAQLIKSDLVNEGINTKYIKQFAGHKSPFASAYIDKKGELILNLKLPSGYHLTEATGSRWQVIDDKDIPIKIDEDRAAGAIKENTTINIPIKLKENAKDGIVRVEAIAYFCKDEGECQISGVLFEIPVVLGQSPNKKIELNHTFNSQVANFGLPFEQNKN